MGGPLLNNQVFLAEAAPKPIHSGVPERKVTFSTKGASDALLGLMCDAFDPNTRKLDPAKLEAAFHQPVLQSVRHNNVIKFLDNFAQGKIKPNDLVTPPVHEPDKFKTMWLNTLQNERLNPGLKQGMLKLLGNDGFTPIPRGKIEQVYETYADPNKPVWQNFNKLVNDLSAYGISEEAILEIASSFYGPMRARVLAGYTRFVGIAADLIPLRSKKYAKYQDGLKKKTEQICGRIQDSVFPKENSHRLLTVREGSDLRMFAKQQKLDRQKQIENPLAYSNDEAARDSSIGKAQQVGGRNNQEDCVFAIERGNLKLIGVGDGMGGHERGELAAAILTEHMSYVKIPDIQSVVREISAAGTQIRDELPNGGTTVAVALIDDLKRMYAVHAGDSRVMVIRGGRVIFTTKDHSYHNYIDAGDPDKSHVLVNHVSHRDRVGNPWIDVNNNDTRNIKAAGIQPIQLLPGDRVVVWTDGVYEYITDNELAALTAQGTAGEIAQRLVDTALGKGNDDPELVHDNATCAVHVVA